MNGIGKPVYLAAFLVLSMTSYSFAGLVRVSCDPGSSVGIAWTDDETGLHGAGATDTNGDGIVEFGIPRQDHVLYGVSVAKTSDGRLITFTLDLNVGGVTLLSLEPFETPSFGAVAAESELVAIIDIAGFLGEGNPFTVGQFLTVTNGTIPETSTITFKDVTGVAFDAEDLLDPGFVASLPNFTGSAEVKPFDSFELQPIPTVSEWGLIILTLLLLTAGTIVIARQRRAAMA